jgi:Bacterial cadherin-like domain/Bacterial Ig-like domain (group 2)
VNPSDPHDHIVSVGDWVRGSPGVNNSSSVRDALRRLQSMTITVPVWDESKGQGNNTQYHIAGFANVHITDFRLSGQNRISAIFKGLASCKPLTAIDDFYSVDEDTTLQVATPGVLANDEVAAGKLAVVLVSDVGHGSLDLNPDGSFTYVPGANFNGKDSFTYKITAQLQSNVATVTITIIPVNDAPVAADDAYSVDENEALRIAAPGVLSNDSDGDGEPITVILFSNTSHGSLDLFSDGSFTYMPDANYSGPDFFSYRANDGMLDSIVATVRITVNVVDTTPPPAPELIEPDDGAVTDATPIFRWSEVTDPSGVSYELQVAKDLAFTPPLVINEATDVTSFTVLDVQALEVGQYFWRVRAKDGAGNTGEFSVIRRFTVPPPVVLQSITVLPRGIYFAQLDAHKPLAVTGHFSDGTTRDLTPGSAGTTYESSNRFVAKVSADGVVTSAGNGSTTIAVRHQGFTANVAVNVEVGVRLQALHMTPESVTLRSAGVAEQLSVSGAFSDDSIKDLTAAATGTIYESSHPSVATVSADGLVTAHAHGFSTITASNEGLSDETEVTVAISTGQGFLRGEVYNDALGLPLAQSAIALLADGSGPLTPPITTIADGQGRFLLPGMEGDALVRVDKAGFTSVERRGSILQNTALTLLDARLTPLDSRLNLVTSALGGQAYNAAKTITLDFPPGSLEADADIRLTAISGQGLLGTLPPGWSPIAAVDVQPAGLRLAQATTLRASSGAGIPSGTTLVAALYDSVEHTWRALGGATVSSDGVTIEHPLMRTGQIAFLLPDPAPIVGSPLEGVGLVPIPLGATAHGHVTPRASPAGEGARAAGNVVLQSPAPLPSGTVVQARVRQRFDLLTGARVVPWFFVEDLVLYAHPRAGRPNSLSATFPITPSLTFGILQLSPRPRSGRGLARLARCCCSTPRSWARAWCAARCAMQAAIPCQTSWSGCSLPGSTGA